MLYRTSIGLGARRIAMPAYLARMLAVGNIVEVAMPTEAMEAARDQFQLLGCMQSHCLSPELLAGEGFFIPCCRFSSSYGSL